MKICSKCKQPGQFYKDMTKKDGLHSICAICHTETRKKYLNLNPDVRKKRNEKSKEWRVKNPEKSKITVKNATLKAKYGITLEKYYEMLEEQNGGCKVCNSAPLRQRLHVDHCHTTGKVRGLLCQACNVSIGKMKESPMLLRKLANYIEENLN